MAGPIANASIIPVATDNKLLLLFRSCGCSRKVFVFMRRIPAVWFCALLCCFFPFVALAEPHLKCVKLVITNPTDEDRRAENIVIPIAEIKKIAPDFYAGSQIV